jgi:RimJ/RimL family protein N-acetyltransferase
MVYPGFRRATWRPDGPSAMRARPIATHPWLPRLIVGERVVLRRHTPANLAAFQRWYTDREVVALTRYRDEPMTRDEVTRFFYARVLGPDSLAMAIHRRSDGRLIGTCSFSQLDPESGSVLYHITIGEKDCWGQGYGTEATQLMLNVAFGTFGLHRVSLTVFAFNERAIRSYRRCGFRVEGRARDAVWRQGRYWDEITMGILRSEWEALQRRDGHPAGGPETGATSADVPEGPRRPVSLPTPRLRRLGPAFRRGRR